MTNNIPYLRNKMPTLLVFSAAVVLLLTIPMLLFNVLLLQPVQAQTNLSFQTPTPANGETGGTLTFNATGTTSTSNPSSVKITNGTIQWQWETGPTYNGEIYSGSFNNNTKGGEIGFNTRLNNFDSSVISPCRTTDVNPIMLTYQNERFDFTGPVECSPTGGGETSPQPSSNSSTTRTTMTQDSDGDGIPDSSDKCPHNSHHRCFKGGGDTSSTTSSSTTQQEQQPSSSSGTGNQTG